MKRQLDSAEISQFEARSLNFHHKTREFEKHWAIILEISILIRVMNQRNKLHLGKLGVMPMLLAFPPRTSYAGSFLQSQSSCELAPHFGRSDAVFRKFSYCFEDGTMYVICPNSRNISIKIPFRSWLPSTRHKAANILQSPGTHANNNEKKVNNRPKYNHPARFSSCSQSYQVGDKRKAVENVPKKAQ